MNKTIQLLCAHMAWPSALILCIGVFGVAGWMPLMEPSLGAEAVAAHFAEHRMEIRIGVSLLAFSGIFWWPFSAAMAIQMKRIEGQPAPLAMIQMAAASGTALIAMFEAWFWLVAAFRPETPPAIIQTLNDFCWLAFVGFYPPVFLQNMTIGICILAYKNDIYPRWVGFANIWLAILYLPGAIIAFFKTGPFSWNGLIGFWLVAVAFFLWMLMMWWMTVKAIRSEGAADGSSRLRRSKP